MTYWSLIFIAFFFALARTLTLSLSLWEFPDNKLACSSNKTSGIESDDCHPRTKLFVRDKLTSRDHRSSIGTSISLAFSSSSSTHTLRLLFALHESMYFNLSLIFVLMTEEKKNQSSKKKSITETIVLSSLPSQSYRWKERRRRRRRRKIICLFRAVDTTVICDYLARCWRERFWHILP